MDAADRGDYSGTTTIVIMMTTPMKTAATVVMIMVKHAYSAAGKRRLQPLHPTTNGEVCSLRQTGRGQRNTSVLAMQNDSLLLTRLPVT